MLRVAGLTSRFWVIGCECGEVVKHPAGEEVVSCPQCGTQEPLAHVRERKALAYGEEA